MPSDLEVNDTNPIFEVLVPPTTSPLFVSYLLARAWFEKCKPSDTPQPVYVTARRK